MDLSKLEEAKDIQRFLEECRKSIHEVREAKKYLNKAQRTEWFNGTLTIHITGNHPCYVSLPNDRKCGFFYPTLNVFLRRFEKLLDEKIKGEEERLLKL